MRKSIEQEQVDTVVIGAGQSGLASGYRLKEYGHDDFVILEGKERVGDTWRDRWDSLRLFSPARYNGLPGMPFPAAADVYPTKDEMADFLEAYSQRFQLPVRTGVWVERLAKSGSRFEIKAGRQEFKADNIIVAMSSFQCPRVPNFAPELDRDIVQLHSSQYRNPSQLQEGPVLLVGASNSGAEIGLELASRHETWLSGRHPGHIPFRIEGRLAHRIFIPFVIGFLFHYVFTTSTPIGRRMRAKLLSQGGLLVRVKPEDLRDAGIRRVPRTTAVRDGLPVLADGRTLEVANVIWCTGYRPSFSWIDLPVFGGQEDPHEPVHQRGVVPQEPGLYFVGLHFLYAHSSTLIRGAGRDAEHVVQHLVSRMR